MFNNRSKLLIIFLALFLIGCAENTVSTSSHKFNEGQNNSTGLTKTEEENSDTSAVGENATNESKFVVLTTALKGEGQGDIAKLVPYVIQGIKTAAVQGNSIAVQDLTKDGALKINNANQLSLIFFLKPDSLIKFNDDPVYVKGSRDAGFLWSCVKTKLEDGINKGAFTQEQKIHLSKLLKDFNITFFNTQGHEITIVMPGNNPIVTLDGQEVTESDEMHEKVAEFFKATF